MGRWICRYYHIILLKSAVTHLNKMKVHKKHSWLVRAFWPCLIWRWKGKEVGLLRLCSEVRKFYVTGPAPKSRTILSVTNQQDETLEIQLTVSDRVATWHHRMVTSHNRIINTTHCRQFSVILLFVEFLLQAPKRETQLTKTGWRSTPYISSHLTLSK